MHRTDRSGRGGGRSGNATPVGLLKQRYSPRRSATMTRLYSQTSPTARRVPRVRVGSEARGHETLVLVPVNLIIYVSLDNELIFSGCRTTKSMLPSLIRHQEKHDDQQVKANRHRGNRGRGL